MVQRRQLMSAVAAVCLASAPSFAGTFTSIAVDGLFDDWTGVPVLTSDPSGDGNPIDIAGVQLANDADNLYLRVTFHTAVNPNVGPSLYLAFDTDSTVATGFNIYGLNFVGSEAGFQNDFPFDQRGGFNSGALTLAATISPVDFADPGHTFLSQEYSIPRALAYANDSTPVFNNPGFNLMLWTDSGIAADTTGAIPYLFASPITGWNNPAGGDWNVATNWTYGVSPNAVGALAEFGAVITAPKTVFTDVTDTVGAIKFDSAQPYTIAGAGSLTLDVATGSATIDVLQGSQIINLPTRLNDNTTATVATGATLTLGDPLTIANGSTLTKAGAGTLEMTSTVTGLAPSTIAVTAGTANLRNTLGTTTTLRSEGGQTNLFTNANVAAIVVNGGTVKVDGSTTTPRVVKTASLTLAAAGKLDIADNGLIVSYSGSSPLAAVRAAIVSAYASGAWTGPGLTSSSITATTAIGYGESAAVAAGGTFLGTSFTGSAVVVRYTLRGDADLTGSVNFDDLLLLAKNFNGSITGRVWTQGDFNYDGITNFDDLLLLAKNFNASVPLTASETSQLDSGFAAQFALAQALVPEPTSIAALSMLVLGVTPRRRRA